MGRISVSPVSTRQCNKVLSKKHPRNSICTGKYSGKSRGSHKPSETHIKGSSFRQQDDLMAKERMYQRLFGVEKKPATFGPNLVIVA